MKNKTKIIASLLGVSAFMSLAVMGGFAKGQKQQFTPAKAEEPQVLYSEDFSGETMPEGWSTAFDLVNGKAVFNAAATWTSVPIPSTAFVTSNNYDISFDLTYTGTADTYFHLVHLDGTAADRNIYLDLIGGGTYWRLADYGTNDIYDNSGDDQGSNYITNELKAKLHDASVKLRFVILDDIVEIHLDESRLIAVPLSAFGNNRYSTRKNITKGILDGFGIDCRAADGELIIDNFVMKEAKHGNPYYYRAEQWTGGVLSLPLNHENLYHSNFQVQASFEVHRSLVENSENHGYPRIGLIMNQILGSGAEPTNSINAQNYLDREFATPWIGAQKHDGSGWGSAGGEYVACNYSDTRYVETVTVIGDRIIFTTDSGQTGDHAKTVIDTSFTALGIPKGQLLTVQISNHFTNASNIEYYGFEGNYGIRAAAQNNRYFVGQNVVAQAKVYGDDTGHEAYAWYVDGVATEQTGLQFESTGLAAGKHTLAYGNAAVKSEAFEIEILENLLTIVGNKTEMYPIDSATFTATLEGALSIDDTQWKVNGETVAGVQGNELVLNNLQPGQYTIQAFIGTVVSNELSLTVRQPSLRIAANKGSFNSTESAELSATALGIASSEVIKWFADDVELAGKTGDSIELAMSAYSQAGEVEIQAKAGEVVSNKVKLFIIKDIYAEISADPNWKVAYQQEIAADSTFGAYAAVEDAAGNYYIPTNATSGNDAQFPAMSIETQSWSMEYDLLIKEEMLTYPGECYVYPQAMGMDSRHPDDWIEIALGLSTTSLRTYVKTHQAGVNYEYADFNTGKDLSYAGSIVNIGWNHIVYAMQGNNAAFYVNGELVFYASIPNSTVPSGFCMSMWPGGSVTIPLGFKNFTVKGIVVPPPAISGVSVNANKISGKVGDSITLSATVTPYNATYETIEWYVNGQKVEGANALTYTFTASAAGTYSVVCKIDGHESAAKVITITADQPDQGGDGGQGGEQEQPAKKGCRSSIIATSALVSITALAGFGFLLSKKRKER